MNYGSHLHETRTHYITHWECFYGQTTKWLCYTVFLSMDITVIKGTLMFPGKNVLSVIYTYTYYAYCVHEETLPMAHRPWLIQQNDSTSVTITTLNLKLKQRNMFLLLFYCIIVMQVYSDLTCKYAFHIKWFHSVALTHAFQIRIHNDVVIQVLHGFYNYISGIRVMSSIRVTYWVQKKNKLSFLELQHITK